MKSMYKEANPEAKACGVYPEALVKVGPRDPLGFGVTLYGSLLLTLV